ncbi:MAG: nitroreductase family protein [Candidatus Nanoarchaeia archaeon]
MEIIEAIEKRRSVRRFKSRAIPKDDLYYLIELAMKAPSAGNLQDYQFIVCTNKDMIDNLPSCCMDQSWIATAPTVIIVCSQPLVQQNWYGPAGNNFARHNGAAATQNILLAAQEFGLSTCWVGGFDTDKINHLFHIPQGVRIEAVIPIGYPDQEAANIAKKGLKTALFYDFYGQDVQDFEKVNREVALLRERKIRHMKKKVQPKISSSFQTLKEKINFPKKKSQEESTNQSIKEVDEEKPKE